METVNNTIIPFDVATADSLIVRNENASFSMVLRSMGIDISMRCNLNGDRDNIVNRSYPLTTIKHFEDVIKRLDKGGIISLEDKDQNIEFQIGIDIGDSVDLFFELIDFEYDIFGGMTTDFSMRINSDHPHYETLKLLMSALELASKEKGTVEDEPKLDNAQYQRSSGL